MASERTYGGRSAQERRDSRRRALLDAGLELIGTQGWTQTSVRGVHQLAGVSPRFFYESFADLDALAVAVYDEIVGAATAKVIAAVSTAGDDRHAQAEAAMRAVVDALTEDPRRARVVFIEALGSEALARRRRRTLRELSAVIEALGEASYDVLPPDPLTKVTSTLLAGGIFELLVAWIDGSVEISEEQLVGDGAALIVGLGDAAATLAAARMRTRA
ncbi:MAG TPA: TetR/AcrR family transcriptional regulator [Solirubrobacteraceae bacterium]|nr:TetR/AcrR family transcriptional regulator [Solirubrobacteraceae bacterium]